MAEIGANDPQHEQFWELAEPHLASGRLVEGTMMGQQCLRTAATDGFVATVTRMSGNVVVKLPKGRVADLVDQGVAGHLPQPAESSESGSSSQRSTRRPGRHCSPSRSSSSTGWRDG